MKKSKTHYPKIHKACSIDGLRPNFAYVFVSKEAIKATDAHVLIQHKTSEIFRNGLVESLPKKAILIHCIHFAEMTRLGCEYHKVEKGLIKYRYRDLWYYVPFQVDGKDINWMKTESIWPEKIEAIEAIGINPNLLNKAVEALDYDARNIRINFYSQMRGMIITIIPIGNFPSAKAIVMPVSIPGLVS